MDKANKGIPAQMNSTEVKKESNSMARAQRTNWEVVREEAGAGLPKGTGVDN